MLNLCLAHGMLAERRISEQLTQDPHTVTVILNAEQHKIYLKTLENSCDPGCTQSKHSKILGGAVKLRPPWELGGAG